MGKIKAMDKRKAYAVVLLIGILCVFMLAGCSRQEAGQGALGTDADVDAGEVTAQASEAEPEETEEDSVDMEEETQGELSLEEQFRQRYASFPEKEEIPEELQDKKGNYQPAPVTREQLDAKIIEIQEYYTVVDGGNEEWIREDTANDIYTMLCLNRPFISDEDLDYILSAYEELLSYATMRDSNKVTFKEEKKTILREDLLFDKYLKIQAAQLEYCAVILYKGNEFSDKETIGKCDSLIKEYCSSYDEPESNIHFQFSMSKDIESDFNKSLNYLEHIIYLTLPDSYQKDFGKNIHESAVLSKMDEYRFTQ